MYMKIKTKLRLGVGLLFGLIILLLIVGLKYVNELKNETENILTANYNSLAYSRNMLEELEETNFSSNRFEKNLNLQRHNITEVGEKEVTNQLTEDYSNFKKHRKDNDVTSRIRNSIHKIMEMNMFAIKRKSSLASKAASEATFWITLTGTLCFLIAFILLINLPSSIANPIRELTVSIKEIAAQKYNKRVHFESHSEFGELATSFNVMAKKLQEYNNSSLAKLMMEKKRIETLINNMHDPVIGLDEELKIIFANEEALAITGLKQEEIIGVDAHEVAIKNDLIRLLVKEIKENHKNSKQKPFKIYANDKESYFEKEILDIEIIPTGEKEKVHIGNVIILRNVTEYKELDFAKTNFIATVSHEFKTPIASIKMSLQLLDNQTIGELNNEQHYLITSIHEDVNRMLKITGELLNMTQVESGNIQLAVVPSDPNEIVSYAIEATKIQAEQKNITIQFDPIISPILVQADTEKTAWVITNLISNAIRFSYENAKIEVKVGEQNEQIEFLVKDYGQGIPPQYLPRIFDRYFKVPGTEKSGTGLGLAISKEFIEAQNGNIKVNSDYGKGTEFKILLQKNTN